MELYQMKYENIADRLKRLATSPQPATLRLTSPTHPSAQRPQLPNTFKREAPPTEADGRNRYMESFKYSKLTMETDISTDQQSLPAPTRNNPRDYLSPTARERKTGYDRSMEYASSTLGREREQEERMTTRRDEVEEAGLAKIKSESTLKIESIMESFNSYKQNKEKFISSLGKYSHNRTETEPATTKYGRAEQLPQPKEDTSRLFTEINNIWEERTEEKAPQFQRSRKVKCQLDELTDLLNETIECQENFETRPKEFSRPKSTLIKNLKTEESMVQDRPVMRTILSPRATRAPGRICKNNTRDMTALVREGF